ncbi:hypothetical protein BH11PSE11_BH11PSE11_20100 [soil metagenome]
MQRKTFLTIAALIAVAVGFLALIVPEILLDSKGVVPSASVNLWMREVGVLLIASGLTAFLARQESDSGALRALFAGNLVLQLGLLPVEPIAYANGVITKLSGIMPNTILHMVLALGFGFYLVKMRNVKEE